MYGASSTPWIAAGIGINTGLAYVGSIHTEGGVANIAILGDSVNTTARLASLAGAGEILIGDATKQAAGLGSQGLGARTLKLKGKWMTVLFGNPFLGGMPQTNPGDTLSCRFRAFVIGCLPEPVADRGQPRRLTKQMSSGTWCSSLQETETPDEKVPAGRICTGVSACLLRRRHAHSPGRSSDCHSRAPGNTHQPAGGAYRLYRSLSVQPA